MKQPFPARRAPTDESKPGASKHRDSRDAGSKPAGLRQEQKAATRKGLVQAASALFARQGILATTTADIAKKVEVSHGTVFIHFPTRDDLVLAVIDDFGARLSARFEESFGSEREARDVLRIHLEVLVEFEDFYFWLVTQAHALPPSVKSTVFMLNAAVSWRLFEAAKPEIASGKLKKMDRHLLFNTWIALVQYYVAHREILAKETPILLEKKDELLKHFMNLIKN